MADITLNRAEAIAQVQEILAALEGDTEQDPILSAKDKCLLSHAGQCGVCEDSGAWTGC